MPKMSIRQAQIVIDRVNTDGRIKGNREELKAAAKVLSEAAGFRIGQEPEEKLSVSGIKFYTCPRCCKLVTSGGNYCFNCGQAFEWGENV